MQGRRQIYFRLCPARAALSLAIAILPCVLSRAQETASDYQVEAAYLYNFAKLADWPKQVLPDNAPLTVGVLGGDDEFVQILRKAMEGKIVGTHMVTVKHLQAGDDPKSCQLLFFRTSERKRIPEIIASLASASILLVGEEKAFLQQGGMINLVLQDGLIGFEIDRPALARANIRVSPQILAGARAVNDSSATASRKIELRVQPEYPQLAQRMNLKGTVQLQAVVDRDGTVKKVSLIGGHPVLAEAALQAVRKWKYAPAREETVELVKVSFGEGEAN